ncbi:trypco2 family protein [Streptomyces sp. NPDC049627]|uniref:trypco2 family protein n=1 Tax=Streptomyces sp. NPDC049627 TaxID=3365595 RepID=UPI0037AF5BDC
MIELAEMIRELRHELTTALADGTAAPLRFELETVEIEATVMVGRKAGAGGKVRFWVVEAGGDAQLESSRTHRISLTLQPRLVAPDGTRRTVLIAGDEAGTER